MNEPVDPIDASLRRMFAPPDLSALHATIDAAAAAEPRARSVRPRARWMAAAALVVAALAVILLGRRDDPTPTIDPAARTEQDAGRVLGDRLAQLHAAGPALPRVDDNCVGEPVPQGACAGEGPRMQPNDELELVGECGAPGGLACDRDEIPVSRLVHLRDRNGAEILVCIEPLHADPHPTLPDDTALTIFRRELGAFVLYEITPLSEPRALDRFDL